MWGKDAEDFSDCWFVKESCWIDGSGENQCYEYCDTWCEPWNGRWEMVTSSWDETYEYEDCVWDNICDWDCSQN